VPLGWFLEKALNREAFVEPQVNSMEKLPRILAIGFAASIAFTVSAAQAQNNQPAPGQNPTSTATQNGTPAAKSNIENKAASSNKPVHARVAVRHRHHYSYHAGYGAYAYAGSRYRYRGVNSSDVNERLCMLSPGSLNHVPCLNRE
jgi:hypothetical protein